MARGSYRMSNNGQLKVFDDGRIEPASGLGLQWSNPNSPENKPYYDYLAQNDKDLAAYYQSSADAYQQEKAYRMTPQGMMADEYGPAYDWVPRYDTVYGPNGEVAGQERATASIGIDGGPVEKVPLFKRQPNSEKMSLLRSIMREPTRIASDTASDKMDRQVRAQQIRYLLEKRKSIANDYMESDENRRAQNLAAVDSEIERVLGADELGDVGNVSRQAAAPSPQVSGYAAGPPEDEVAEYMRRYGVTRDKALQAWKRFQGR